MNLNGKQIIGIAGAILGALIVSTTQLTDLFGPAVTKTIISTAALINLILNSVTVAISSQGSLVRDVAAMPGVDKIQVNTQATQALAQVATDPQQPKVGGLTQKVQNDLKDIATGAVS